MLLPRAPAISLSLLLTILVAQTPARAHNSSHVTTLAGEANNAAFVVYGKLTNPNPDKQTTDLEIMSIIKNHAWLKGKKTVPIPRFFKLDELKTPFMLVFVDFYKNKPDPYRGLPIDDKSMITYLIKGLECHGKGDEARLGYYFEFLGHGNLTIAVDAYNEFKNTGRNSVEKFILSGNRESRASTIKKWLSNSNRKESYQFGLFGLMLGLCGSAGDADVLKQLWDNASRRNLTYPPEGLLIGYIRRRPEKGWNDLLELVDGKSEFNHRYAALRTIRDFWEHPIKEIPRRQLVKAYRLYFPQSDIADIAIEDLRKYRYWKLTDEILALSDRESHNNPIVQRSILRYALSCENEIPAAKEFVANVRKDDPDRVHESEKLLKYEKQAIEKATNGPHPP